MDIERIKLIIAEGEGLTVEFKEKFTPRIDRDIVAMANGRGGIILLGVDDSGKVTGERLTNTMKAELTDFARNCDPHITLKGIIQCGEVIAVEVPQGQEKPYSCSSGYFRRLDAVTQKMTQKEVRTIFRETTDVLFESLDCPEMKREDISIKRIRTFFQESGTAFKVRTSNLTSVLASIGVSKGGRVSNAGALMFAEEIRRFIPYCETILAAFKGIDKTYIYDRKDLCDDLLTQLNEAMAFLKKHLNVRSEIRELNRHDIYEIPLDALREALVNALVHRDYSVRGTNISVNIFDDRVEIVNPGGLPAGLTKENFGKESVRRNLLIADLFHRMDKMERVGSGIGRMCSLMKAAGLKQPVFEPSTFFRVIFYRSPEYALKSVGEEKLVEGLVEGLVENQRKILNWMRENPLISKKELSEKLGISTTAIDKNILQLKKKGLLRRIGPDKGGRWEVIGA